MKRFLLMTSLLLGIMGMAFSDVRGFIYDTNTIEGFEDDWAIAESDYPLVCIGFLPMDDDDERFGLMTYDDLDALCFVYFGKKDVTAAFCYPDEKKIVDKIVFEDEGYTNQKWFSLPKQKEEARKYWDALVKATK